MKAYKIIYQPKDALGHLEEYITLGQYNTARTVKDYIGLGHKIISVRRVN